MISEIPRNIDIQPPHLAVLQGARATLELEARERRRPVNGTARHEAKHVVAALETGTQVSKVTIVPGEGYLGLTELLAPNAIAALAPHETGESGTSWDVHIAERIGAHGAAQAARSIIENNMDKVDAVACALEDYNTLDSFGIKRAINDLKKPTEQFGILRLELPTGEKVEDKVQVRDNIIMNEGVWYSLANKATRLN